jgi:hypothetical protein
MRVLEKMIKMSEKSSFCEAEHQKNSSTHFLSENDEPWLLIIYYDAVKKSNDQFFGQDQVLLAYIFRKCLRIYGSVPFKDKSESG